MASPAPGGEARLSITLTGGSPSRTKITFPSVPGIWYDLEEASLHQWLYKRSTIGTGGETSFVNNIFAPHYDYRVRAVRVED